jgi:tripeptide aminopeptidase
MSELREAALARFLRYVQVDTASNDAAETCPSTTGQWTLLRELAAELEALGAAEVSISEHGYVFATVPATVDDPAVPTIGFLAHVDTSPELPGAAKPIVWRSFQGDDLVLPDDPTAVLSPERDQALAAHVGHDIVTASGTTLLGADDKAGVAAVVSAVEYLLAHPEIPHGRIRVGLTPDEEIGRGANHFDVAHFGAAYAYTLDGGPVGELEYESFSADTMVLTFHGFNTHPGYAKAKMINSIKVAADFVAGLPRDMAPETTSGHEGYVHPYVVESSVERTVLRVLLRDFDTAQLAVKAELLRDLAAAAVARWPGARVEHRIEQSYRNMREVLEQHPEVVERARRAMRRMGLEVHERPIRGGTDGSRLSFMGLPTPNLFSGQHNIHSRLEWLSAQDLEQAVLLIVELAREWAGEAP